MTQFNEVGTASEAEKPKKCPCKCKAIVAAILVVLIAGAICWHVHRPLQNPQPTDSEISSEIDLKPGGYYTVFIRRDMLGAATNLPISPTATSINGASVSVQGRLLDINHEALLLENTDRGGRSLYWIPKNSILMIQIGVTTTI